MNPLHQAQQEYEVVQVLHVSFTDDPDATANVEYLARVWRDVYNYNVTCINERTWDLWRATAEQMELSSDSFIQHFDEWVHRVDHCYDYRKKLLIVFIAGHGHVEGWGDLYASNATTMNGESYYINISELQHQVRNNHFADYLFIFEFCDADWSLLPKANRWEQNGEDKLMETLAAGEIDIVAAAEPTDFSRRLAGNLEAKPYARTVAEIFKEIEDPTQDEFYGNRGHYRQDNGERSIVLCPFLSKRQEVVKEYESDED